MSSIQHDALATYLLNHRILTAEQLAEVQDFVEQSGMRLRDALVKLGYLSVWELTLAEAEVHGLQAVNLADITIPPAVIELVPESVARENVILPLKVERGRRRLFILISDPTDTDTLEKLAFILNVEIYRILAPREAIIEAINRYYGQSETESVDSMLQEFTDTQIDFTDMDACPEPGFKLSRNGSVARTTGPAEEEESSSQTAQPARLVQRQATVRYYHRMNPARMFPLLVILSKKKILEVVKRHVSQAKSESFQAAHGSSVEVEPILPGCTCYPPREQLPIREEETSATFWVVPNVLGQVMQARVVVRQEGKVLAEVPLQVCVVKQGLTLLLGALSLLLPLVLLVLKHFRLDFESQLQEGFGLYAQLVGWTVNSLSPEALTGVLLLATVGAYFWLRPRQREVFWDIETSPTAEPVADCETVSPAEALPGRGVKDGKAIATSQATTLSRAERCFVRKEYRQALALYREGLQLGQVEAKVHLRAALAAHYLGDSQQALEILEEASLSLHPLQISGAIWYNMGCFATRLGRFGEAIRYLHRAVDAGHADPNKYRTDPDLAPLRWRAEFKRLLASLRP